MVMKRKPSLRTTPARPRRPMARDLKGNPVLGAKEAPQAPSVDKKLSALVAADAKKKATTKPPPRAVAVGPARPKRVGKVPVRRTKGGSKDMGSTASRRKPNTQSTRARRLAQARVAQAQRAASAKRTQRAASTTRPKNLKRASTRSRRRVF